MSNFKCFIRRKFDKFFGGHRLSNFWCELESIAKLLIFFATVGLFIYALIFPNFWIILITFLLFLALLALILD